MLLKLWRFLTLLFAALRLYSNLPKKVDPLIQDEVALSTVPPVRYHG